MKDLYKLAIAFEKASQMASYPDPLSSPTGDPAKLTPVPAKQKPQFYKFDPSIQKSLKQLGYSGELKPTGVLDASTAKALQWFRDTRFLPPAIPYANVLTQIKNESAGPSAHEMASFPGEFSRVVSPKPSNLNLSVKSPSAPAPAPDFPGSNFFTPGAADPIAPVKK